MKSKDMPGMHMRAPAKKEEEKEKSTGIRTNCVR